jgi:hypothetical protein
MVGCLLDELLIWVMLIDTAVRVGSITVITAMIWCFFEPELVG